MYERSTWLFSSLASYASLLFWRPPVSGLIEMFLQKRAVAALCEPAIETVLEIKVSIVRRPVTLCQANEQEEEGVKKSITKDQLLLTVEEVKRTKSDMPPSPSSHSVDFDLPALEPRLLSTLPSQSLPSSVFTVQE